MTEATETKNSVCTWLRRLAALHDAVTKAGYLLAGLCLVVIVCSFCFEVVARYFFSSPTTWASSMVAYMLCAMVFLAMPELSRQRIHIFISIVLDLMTPERATVVQRCTRVIAAAACLLAAWFSLDATWTQFNSGIETVNEWRIQKWMLSIVIPYGLFSTSIYFLRQAADKQLYQASGATGT